MAFYVSKSRRIFSGLNPKMGFLGTINPGSWSSYFTHNHASLSKYLRYPTTKSCKQPTLFTPHRFKSVRPDNQLDSMHSDNDAQVFF